MFGRYGLSQPNNPLEKEADRVADDVMRTPEAGAPTVDGVGGLAVHRKCHRAVDLTDTVLVGACRESPQRNLCHGTEKKG